MNISSSALHIIVLGNQDIVNHTVLPQPIMTKVVANKYENHIELAHKLDRCKCTNNYGLINDRQYPSVHGNTTIRLRNCQSGG